MWFLVLAVKLCFSLLLMLADMLYSTYIVICTCNDFFPFTSVVTFFQILIFQLQFGVGIVYAIQGIYVDCDYPHWMGYVGIGYGITITALFMNFYIQAYLSKPKSVSAKQVCVAFEYLVFVCLFVCCHPSCYESITLISQC